MIQETLRAPYTRTQKTVYVDGTITHVESYITTLRAGDRAKTTVYIPLPSGDHIQPNSEIEIWDGHDNFVGRKFWGRLPAWESGFSTSGDYLIIDPVGWSSLLDYNDRFDLVFDGPITIRAIFDSLCSRRGVPSYRADAVMDDTGSWEVQLGGNPFIDDGQVIIPSATSPLEWLNGVARIFGYHVFDDALGTVRLSRISGGPSGNPVVAFIEGENLINARRTYDTSSVVKYWEVLGPTYENDIGRLIPIRSIPEFTNPSPLVPVNNGISFEPYRSNYLVTQQLADVARRRLEIDTSEPEMFVRWSSVSVPGISPGDVVWVQSESAQVAHFLWVTSVTTGFDSGRGLFATYEGRAGTGVAMPSGIDLITMPLQIPPIHLGDEHVPWYAHPAPQGKEWSWDFHIPKRATAINVLFDVHGSNSQYIGGQNTDLTVSRFEIRKLPIDNPDAPPHSQGSLPILDENYAQRLKYATDDSAWSPGAITLRGFGDSDINVRLTLKSGENKKAVLGPWDDFEIRNMHVEIYGTVEPVIMPGELS